MKFNNSIFIRAAFFNAAFSELMPEESYLKIFFYPVDIRACRGDSNLALSGDVEMYCQLSLMRNNITEGERETRVLYTDSDWNTFVKNLRRFLVRELREILEAEAREAEEILRNDDFERETMEKDYESSNYFFDCDPK